MPTYELELTDAEVQDLERLAETAGGTVADYIVLLIRDELLFLREEEYAPPPRPHLAEPGQGMVEYGLIIAAVAIAVIIALFSLGPKVASMFSNAASSLQ